MRYKYGRKSRTDAKICSRCKNELREAQLDPCIMPRVTHAENAFSYICISNKRQERFFKMQKCFWFQKSRDKAWLEENGRNRKIARKVWLFSLRAALLTKFAVPWYKCVALEFNSFFGIVDNRSAIDEIEITAEIEEHESQSRKIQYISSDLHIAAIVNSEKRRLSCV